MKQAIRAAFPDATLVSCSRHLQKNVDEHLGDKISVCQKDRTLIGVHFRPKRCDERWQSGDIRLQLTDELCTAITPSFDRYFHDRLIDESCTAIAPSFDRYFHDRLTDELCTAIAPSFNRYFHDRLTDELCTATASSFDRYFHDRLTDELCMATAPSFDRYFHDRLTDELCTATVVCQHCGEKGCSFKLTLEVTTGPNSARAISADCAHGQNSAQLGMTL